MRKISSKPQILQHSRFYSQQNSIRHNCIKKQYLFDIKIFIGLQKLVCCIKVPFYIQLYLLNYIVERADVNKNTNSKTLRVVLHQAMEGQKAQLTYQTQFLRVNFVLASAIRIASENKASIKANLWKLKFC